MNHWTLPEEYKNILQKYNKKLKVIDKDVLIDNSKIEFLDWFRSNKNSIQDDVYELIHNDINSLTVLERIDKGYSFDKAQYASKIYCALDKTDLPMQVGYLIYKNQI